VVRTAPLDNPGLVSKPLLQAGHVPELRVALKLWPHQAGYISSNAGGAMALVG